MFTVFSRGSAASNFVNSECNDVTINDLCRSECTVIERVTRCEKGAHLHVGLMRRFDAISDMYLYML